MNLKNQRTLTAILCSIFIAVAIIANMPCIYSSSNTRGKAIVKPVPKPHLNAIDASHALISQWPRGFGDDEAYLKIARSSKSTVIQKALQIRDKIAVANYCDVKTLCAKVKQAVKVSTLKQADIVEKTIQLLRTQRKVAQNLHKYATRDHHTPFKMRFELRKICVRDTYQAAIDLLNQYADTLLRGELTFRPVQRTVVDLKFLLIYLLLILDKSTSITALVETSHLQLFFPVSVKHAARLPADVKLKDLKLFDPKTNTFWIPNSGYVIAADPIEQQIRGTDCSGLVALTFNNAYHFSTKELAQIWKLKHKRLTSGQVSAQVRTEATHYETVDPAALEPGDLVIWRWKDNGTQRGHTVFFVNWAHKPDTFISMEVAMLPSEHLDGVGARALSLRRPNAKLYILRRIATE